MQWVADVYHVMLYLSAAAATPGTDAAAKRWVGQRVPDSIEMGSPRFVERLQAIGPPNPVPGACEPWAKLLN